MRTIAFTPFVALLAALAGLPAQAAPRTVAEVAQYEGADRQAVLEAGAKKEGQVLLYTVGTQTQPVLEAFMKKYPFVRLGAFRGDASVVARKVLEEYKAGRHTVDAIDMNTGGLQPLRAEGYLQPYKSPELLAIRKESIEPSSLWALSYESYLSLGYNTKAIAEKDVPRTYEDLLDPKWQGKMAVPGTSTFPNWVGAILLERGKEKGEEYLKRLARQKIRIYEISGRAVANLVVSGEVPLSPVIYSSHMANSIDDGASVDWVALGPVYSTVGGVALAAKSPNPHAGMLYVDFMLSREGQIMRQKLGYATARTDLQNKEKPSKILYLSERPTYNEEFEAWQDTARRIFGRGENRPGAK